MFNNTIKKFVATGLLFSLYAPCSFVSAQNFGRNGMNIPLGNSRDQQNRTIDEDFIKSLAKLRKLFKIADTSDQRKT